MPDEPIRFHDVAPAEVLAADGTHAVEIEGRAVLLCRSGGRWFAVQRWCSHAGQPLDGGSLRHGEIVCPHHGARFSLETGAHRSPPASRGLRTFPVRVRHGRIEVGLSAS